MTETTPAAPATTTTTAPATGGTALGTEPKWEDTVPAKFREGGKPDGAIKHDAIYKSYGELEGRMGKVGLPPEKPDGYKFDLKDDAPLDKDYFTSLRTKAHAAGFSQPQFEALAASQIELAQAVASELTGDLLGTQQACEEALAKAWPDAKERATHRAAANRAFKAFSGDGELLKVIGNMPGVVKMLAKIGAEVKEDRVPDGAETAPDEIDKQIATLTNDPAYTNSFMPKHNEVKAKVTALFAQKYGQAAVRKTG